MYGQQVLLSVARDGTNILKLALATPGTNVSHRTPTARAAIRHGTSRKPQRIKTGIRGPPPAGWTTHGAILTRFSFLIAPTTPVVFGASASTSETGPEPEEMLSSVARSMSRPLIEPTSGAPVKSNRAEKTDLQARRTDHPRSVCLGY